MTTIEQLIKNPVYTKKVILEKLICHALHINKKDLFLDPEKQISTDTVTWITQAYHAYTVEKKPLEHIIGRVEFLTHRFKVTPATLIPRPETEYMIDAINEWLQIYDSSPSLLDIGTGCGVLGLSVLLHNPGKIQESFLTDLSQEALAIAKENYTTYNTDNILGSVTFLESNLLDHKDLVQVLHNGESVLLVANLPYIPEQLFEDNTDDRVKKREPKMAFVGGADGLDLYRIMFDQLVASKNTSTTMFLEMMTRQVDILRSAYPMMQFEEVKTFHFNIRIVKASIVN